ncbi:hypothetical protein GALMADRAFT_141059 [Galerina marginata CBS 339.88]|uniref:Uncharacterized protein n=1 Tax=Galerina marginata (strain CBS 339.88) TaxID=685588 RepID=A0A067SXC3_GALM3|nr:hypothetical protein GALMADRAFT_141059 [Galerina marginata CBS 339.88]
MGALIASSTAIQRFLSSTLNMLDERPQSKERKGIRDTTAGLFTSGNQRSTNPPASLEENRESSGLEFSSSSPTPNPPPANQSSLPVPASFSMDILGQEMSLNRTAANSHDDPRTTPAPFRSSPPAGSPAAQDQCDSPSDETAATNTSPAQIHDVTGSTPSVEAATTRSRAVADALSENAATATIFPAQIHIKGTLLMSIQTNNQVFAVAFSPDGKKIVSSSGSELVHVWDALTGKELKTLNGHTSWVRSVTFSPDGKQIVSGAQDNTLCIWDASTGDELNVLAGHTNWVTSVKFSPDSKQIVSGSYDKSVCVWDAFTGEKLKVMNGHTDTVESVAFSPDGKSIVSGSLDKSVHIWDALTGNELKVLHGHTDWITSVAFSPDGKQIISGSHDETVRIWDASTGNELMVLIGHKDWVRSVVFSPDGKLIASGSLDRSVCIWDALTGKELKVLTGHTSSVESVAFPPDGKQIVSGSYDKSVWIWDVDPEPTILDESEPSTPPCSPSLEPPILDESEPDTPPCSPSPEPLDIMVNETDSALKGLIAKPENKDKLDTDDKKILVVLSFLRGGEAEEWAQQFVNNAAVLTLANPAVTGFGVYTEFMKQLKDAFKPFDKVGDAVDELEKLQMGDRPAADHVTTFNALLARSEIKDDATIIRLF